MTGLLLIACPATPPADDPPPPQRLAATPSAPAPASQTTPTRAETTPPAPPAKRPNATTLIWGQAPPSPSQISASSAPRVVLVSAEWCQWCMVFEHEVLRDDAVAAAIAGDFEALH
ncbi:MAG TPA: hypothetical protein ENK31_00865, partial [Nannocystis exedens]|nr:hypothetical protein [Nannocystis exedens]